MALGGGPLKFPWWLILETTGILRAKLVLRHLWKVESLGTRHQPLFFEFRLCPKNKWCKYTLPETNMRPTRRPFEKERIVFQPPFFRCHVSFREGSFSRTIYCPFINSDYNKPQNKDPGTWTNQKSMETSHAKSLKMRKFWSSTVWNSFWGYQIPHIM